MSLAFISAPSDATHPGLLCGKRVLQFGFVDFAIVRHNLLPKRVRMTYLLNHSFNS